MCEYKNNSAGCLQFYCINAGLDNISDNADIQGAILRTASHELTHFIQNWNPSEYENLKKAVLDYLEKQEKGSVDRLAAKKISIYENQGEKLTLENAVDEVVADGCEMFLKDSTAVTELARENMTLAEKIKSWIDGYIENIKKAFARVAPHSEEAQLLSHNQAEFEKIQKLWDSALKNAARNSRTLGTIETDGKTQFSFGVTQDEINDYVEKAKIKENEKDYKKYAKVTDKLLSDVSEEIDLKGYSHALRDNDIRHILNSHGETTNEKYPVTLDDIKAIPYIVENYDKVFYKTNDKGQPGVIYIKVGSNNVVYYVEAITEKYGSEKLLINKQMIKTGFENIPKLFGLKTAITKKQTEFEFLSDLLQIRKAYAQSEYQNQPVNNSIPNPDKNVKQKSAHDTEYLNAVKSKDMETAQKLVDEAAKNAGYTARMWHGSKKGGGFTQFRDWAYFTENKAYAERYAERDNAASLYESYIKLQKPFDTTAMSRMQCTRLILLFIKRRVESVEVFIIHFICCKTESFAESLIVDYLTFTQEFYNVTHIGIINKT